MPKPVIKAEGLSKKYVIARNGERGYVTLRDAVAEGFRRAGGRLLSSSRGGSGRGGREEFWALKDVSFEVGQGEVVGIIGRNGAGKSTLLKVLSRITEPTAGRVRVRGRVASLLEVGTGFHPELTGRENIYLNGAVLGMKRAEIRGKFDDIVAFAEVEKFLDTPVKRYSSGMYMRLAFAVAAHLEPEVLVVDEVLAVGDIEFQKKCLGKMREVSTDGKTVLFVSHNMSAVQALCTKVIQLRGGRIFGAGDVKQQVELYTAPGRACPNEAPACPVRLSPNLTLERFEFLPHPVRSGDEQEFTVRLSCERPEQIRSVVILIYAQLGFRVAIVDLRNIDFPVSLDKEAFTIRGKLHSLPLVEGEYRVGLYVETRDLAKDYFDLFSLTVTEKEAESKIVPYPPEVRGVIELEHESSASCCVGGNDILTYAGS